MRTRANRGPLVASAAADWAHGPVLTVGTFERMHSSKSISVRARQFLNIGTCPSQQPLQCVPPIVHTIYLSHACSLRQRIQLATRRAGRAVPTGAAVQRMHAHALCRAATAGGWIPPVLWTDCSMAAYVLDELLVDAHRELELERRVQVLEQPVLVQRLVRRPHVCMPKYSHCGVGQLR